MLIFGIALFAVGIVLSIVWHEYGHYSTARHFGMLVRRFYVGMGPTVWSYRRGETEYGLAALPVGGFCDIAGMTTSDELDPADEPRAMHSKPAWQRIIVMIAGPVMNFILGFVLFFGVALTAGLPNIDQEPIPASQVPAVVGTTQCIEEGCTGGGPAGDAGVLPGDRLTEIDSVPIDSWADVSAAVEGLGGQQVEIVVDRGGALERMTADVASREVDGQQQGVLGITLDADAVPQEILDDPRYQNIAEFTPITAVGGTLEYTGHIMVQTVKGIATFPSKIPGVAQSIFGGERADDSPVSIVGASHIGGQVVDHGMWASFFLLLGALNFFIGGFNLIPLLPFDGGHIAVILYEKVRDALRKRRGLAPGGPADYEKLMPLTLGVFAILISVSAIVIVADFVNPMVLNL